VVSDRDHVGAGTPALAIEDLTVAFGHRARRVVAVDRVSLAVAAGATLGIVGESGCGKSTLARTVAGLQRASSGRVYLAGRGLPARRTRADTRRIQLVFQDPAGSLNPRMTIAELLGDALSSGALPRKRHLERIRQLLADVQLAGLDPGARPSQLSGGQRQRIALARALAAEPQILICDEVTSALDVSARGAMLNLLRRIQREHGCALIFISHDIAAVRYISHEIAVMYLGRVVERGDSEELITAPQHPYTRTLIDSIPVLGTPPSSDGTDFEPPDPRDPPSGCPFHPRCPVGPLGDASRTVCYSADPHPDAPRRTHAAACHFAPALSRGPQPGTAERQPSDPSADAVGPANPASIGEAHALTQ
jgi:peptide/nickel transport system ATP-binding protein